MMNEPKQPPKLTAPPPHASALRGESGVLAAGGSGRQEGGFSATLKNAGLWDLVQLRCESRTRCVVCVTSARGVGYLYFAEGQIVHAVTGGVQGERAVLEILCWTAGTWDACERPWPTVPTITTSWQGLFLRAAAMQDEAARRGSEAPVAPAVPASPMAPVRLASAPPASPGAPRSQPVQRAPAPARREESGVSYRPEDFEHAVRMDARGTIVAGHGAVDDYARLAAYCCRLGDLLGELLGMGKLHGLDAGLRGTAERGGRAFVVRKANGDTIVLRPRPDVDPTKIRAQLNL